MALPGEYVIEDAVRSIDDVIVYRANHPIHGVVNVYQPDYTLPAAVIRVVRQRLYQKGLRMRNLSLLNVPFVTKALEVSQNPNEPYVVTKYAKHDLEDLISNGVIIKPKRLFTILSQVLDAILNLAANGWVMERIHPRQIKLPEINTGNVSFTIIEGTEQQLDAAEATATQVDKTPGSEAVTAPFQEKSEGYSALVPTVRITQGIEETQTQEGTASISVPQGREGEDTVTLETDTTVSSAQRQARIRQRNIYLFGSITYQLLFGRTYQSNDKPAAMNIKRLGRRWRKVLEKALNEDVKQRYDTYEKMRRDVKRSLDRNKRLALASVPFLLLLALIGSYFAYEQYRRHKIMTSEAGQAIKSFLEIVNKTNDDFPELGEPKETPPPVDEQSILSPFDKVEPIEEN
ncbi:MAG: serine/threonine-protein kinase [Planctomycetota bacterium]|jgi:serine/threonine protein kinase